MLTTKYGIEAEDIIFDPLVFPIGTGDENYSGSGVEVIEGIRLIKRAMPSAKTILGVSNVSFGLPAAGREVVNSVFLHDCTKAGLDLAIVNPEKIQRYASIPEHESLLAENLLNEPRRGSSPRLPRTSANGRARRPRRRSPACRSTSAWRGTWSRACRDGLVPSLDEALREGRRPLDVVNGPLMAGMDEVGRLFNDNKLIDVPLHGG